MTSALVQAVLDKLHGVKSAGPDKWQALCPVHEPAGDGHRPSLSVGLGDDGNALVKCMAGCETEAVVKALGLTMADLFDRPKTDAPRTPTGRIVKTYDYRDDTGALLSQVVRLDPKNFRQRRPDGNGGWIWNMADVRRVLYRLRELLAADKSAWVFAVEGEKDADNLAALGLVATCNPGGAGKWKSEYSEVLRGRRVAILWDKDKPDKNGKIKGLEHARDVARSLQGIAADVRIVELPDVAGATVKDASDWIDALDAKDSEDLAKALVTMADTAKPWTPPAAPAEVEIERGVFVRLSDVAPEPVRWLWPGRLALGKLSIIAGNPGLGKSCISLDLAARVTRGAGWPDDPLSTSEPGGVVLLSAEDDLSDTIRPRLDAAAADVSRVLALTTIKRYDPELKREVFASFNLATDLSILESGIAQVENCRLVVVDPLAAFLGKADSHNDAQVRGLLAPLAELAARHHIAIVGISHLNKGQGDALARVMGSIGFVAAARAVFAVAKDREDPSRRLFLPVKNNLGNDATGFAYRLVIVPGGVPCVVWESAPVAVSADDAVAPLDQRRGPEPEDREEAQSWLVDFLAGGPRPANECFVEAMRVGGITRVTLKRAKAAAGVVAEKQGYDGPWTWRLPGYENVVLPMKTEGTHEDTQTPLF